jgi:DNA (cytosine-5)-methyltransferase 1
MIKLRVLSLFAGIGGFDLGLERTGGFETVAFCEIDPFCQRVLAKHWPKVPCYDDVRTLTGERLAADGVAVDIICGGFPCQDVSIAGAREGLDGERSGLWYDYRRLIGELRPRYVLVENVAELLGNGMGRVLGSLAEIGYDAEWYCIPASYLGAWHKRDRVWVVAYPHEVSGCEGRSPQPILRQSDLSFQSPRVAERWPGRSNLPSPRLCGARDGVPDRVGRIASCGNAVVPQIPELIGRAILAARETERLAA